MSTECNAGESIAKGEAVCVTGFATGRPTVLRATPANLESAKAVFGVAEDADAGGTVFVLVAGEVASNAITALGAGSSALVVTDFADAGGAALVRLNDDGAVVRQERFVVGTCDGAGDVTIQPRHDSDETGFARVFNVRAYGAAGNYPTDDPGDADSDAFDRAIAAMGDPTLDRSQHVLYVPAGRYKLTRDLVIDRALLLMGTGGGAAANTSYSGSTLEFTNRYTGIRLMSSSGSATGGNAEQATIRDIDLVSVFGPGDVYPDTHPAWEDRSLVGSFTAGDRIIPAASRASRDLSSLEYHYECVVGGHTGASEPDWRLYQVPNPAQGWAPSTAYRLHDFVYGAAVRTDVFFELTAGVGASSGAMEPAAFSTASPNDTISDSGLTWTCRATDGLYFVEDGECVWATRLAAGIYAQVPCRIENVLVQEFLNAGIHIQASSTFWPPSNANNFSIRNVRCWYNGGGLVTRSDESNAGLVENLQVRCWDRDDREFGIAERSFLGNRYVNCLVESVQGPAFQVPNGASNSGAFIGCYCEGSTGLNDIRSSEFQVIGGTWGTGFTATSTFTGFSGPTGWKGVRAPAVASGGQTIDVSLTPDAGRLLGLQTNDSLFNNAFAYGEFEDGVWLQQAANSPIYATYGVSGTRAAMGLGLFWLPRGARLGWGGTSFYVFTDDDLRRSSDVRFGERVVGDRVLATSFVAKAGFADRIVVTAGFDGVPWSASMQARPGELAGPIGTPATTVRPSSPTDPAYGQVFMCMRADGPLGEAGAMEPTPWPTTTGERARVWTAGMYAKLGSLVRPTAVGVNDDYFMCTTIDTGDEGQTDVTEPSPWPNDATEIHDGSVWWTRQGSLTAGSWIEDGDLVWVCIGDAAEYAEANFIPQKGELVTTDATPLPVDAYEPLEGTTTLSIRVTAYDEGGVDGAEFHLKGVYRRSGGTTYELANAFVGTPTQSAGATTWDAELDLVGNTVSVNVTGALGTTIRWRVIRDLT